MDIYIRQVLYKNTYICVLFVWKNACLNYCEFDLEGYLVGVPHTWFWSDQSFITLLKLIWSEKDILAMNDWKRKCVDLQRTWVKKRTELFSHVLARRYQPRECFHLANIGICTLTCTQLSSTWLTMTIMCTVISTVYIVSITLSRHIVRRFFNFLLTLWNNVRTVALERCGFKIHCTILIRGAGT